MIARKKTKCVRLGKTMLGGDAPILIQSMLNVPAADVAGNVAQAKALEAAGCELIRFAVPTMEDVRLIPAIQAATSVPLVADIHFDAKIALACAEKGIDKIRLNPGNIGNEADVRAVVSACQERQIPIRIGVNSGSVVKDALRKYGGPTPEALCESALSHVRLLEKNHFDQIVISIKASRVQEMIAAYRLMSAQVNYPLHLGVTEAGTEYTGLVKSAMGIGCLLAEGIGDTIRVSLTADPIQEIKAAKAILQGLECRSFGPKITSCPTCGRTKIDLISLAHKVEAALQDCKKDLHVAVMGCAVNGPGEAREADVGVAGGNGEGLLFKKGEIVRKVPENEIIPALLDLIETL